MWMALHNEQIFVDWFQIYTFADHSTARCLWFGLQMETIRQKQALKPGQKLSEGALTKHCIFSKRNQMCCTKVEDIQAIFKTRLLSCIAFGSTLTKKAVCQKKYYVH